jgi:hypothetical protein
MLRDMPGDTSVAAHSGDTSVAYQAYKWRGKRENSSPTRLFALLGPITITQTFFEAV